jgi:DNA-binding transcriptional LysR family regulator
LFQQFPKSRHLMCTFAQSGGTVDWDDLRLFLAVARNGSISGGAKELGVQHSTVSRRMRSLEESLGVRLFEKKKLGYELTVAGEHLQASALRMEQEALGIDGALLGKDAKLTGSLRVTAINNMATSVLMPMFASFSRRYPDIDLHVMVSNSDASLSQREADVAIRLTNAPTDTLIGKQVATVASTVYGSRTYLAELRRTGREPKWLGVECCVFHKAWTKKACCNPVHNFFIDDTLLTQAALRESVGVSILPCFMGDPDPKLERYRDPNPEWNLGLWLLLHPDLKRTARVLAFRDHMLESIKAITDLFEGKAAC